MIVVSDTSAVTSLLQIGRGELLYRIYGDIFIPEAVQQGLLVAHPTLPGFIESVRRVALELETTATFHVSEAVKEIIFRAAGEL